MDNGEIVLYSTHCPKCKVLETKLRQKNIDYTELNDVSELIEKGFKSAPVLKVNDKYLEFGDANKYINSLESR